MREIDASTWCRYCRRYRPAGWYGGPIHEACYGPKDGARDARGYLLFTSEFPSLIKAGEERYTPPGGVAEAVVKTAPWPCVPCLTLRGHARRLLGLPVGAKQ